jgi:ligand-binding sensor domain-containing protein/signal transduction histidine kinase
MSAPSPLRSGSAVAMRGSRVARHTVWLAGLVWAVTVPPADARLLEAQQEFIVRSWDARNGLPGNAVTAITRTEDGYLWIGTRRGLARFDGVRFRVFDRENSPSLRTNFIHALLCDSLGNLWIGTGDGLLRVARGQFDLAGAVAACPGLPVVSLAEAPAGGVQAAVPGLGLITFRGRQMVAATNRIALGPDTRLLADSSNRLWAVAAGKLAALTPGAAVDERNDLEVTAAGVSAAGGLWLATGRRVSHIASHPPAVAGQGARLTSDMLLPSPRELGNVREAPQAVITTLLEDGAGRAWAGTHGGGVFCYDAEHGWQRVTARRARQVGAVSVLFEDRDGAVWIGTLAGGLHQVKPRIVSTWPLPLAAHESLPHTVCAAHDGSLWVGTDGAGVFRLTEGSFARFDAGAGQDNPTVITILEDRRRRLWFGTMDGVIRLEGDRLAAVPGVPFPNRTVSALYEDRAGDLWIGTVGAVLRQRDGAWEAYELGQRHRQFEVRALAEDSRGQMWVGTRGRGLFKLVNGRLRRQAVFPRPAVMALHCDAEDVLWIGTLNSGLYRLQGERVRHWDAEDGLPDNTIYAILEDAAGDLWMSSNEGIFGLNKTALAAYSRANRAPLLAMRLTVEEGLSDPACAGSGQPSAVKSPDGRFWFPTAQGVVSFDPARVPRSRPPAAVLIEEAWADGNPIPLSEAHELRLPSSARRLEFRYTSPDLEAPTHLRFRYQLEGLDADWVDAGGQRVASYSRLAPGRYEFRVMAGVQGAWRYGANSLAIRIVPRWWERGDVQGVGALAALGLVALAVRTVERGRARRRLARLELEQAMAAERARIARDLHDDLGAAVTEILLLGELAERAPAPPGELRAQLGTITEKVRQLARAMDEVVWTVNPKNDTLSNLTSYMADFAREFFRPTPIRCRIDRAEGLPALAVSAAQRHHLFLAFKEALNNVARHSGANEVWLRMRWETGALRLLVEDNGRGFVVGPDDRGAPSDRQIEAATPAADPKRGADGLRNMRARLAAVGGETVIESEPGRGTVVRFTLPLAGESSLKSRGSRRSPE